MESTQALLAAILQDQDHGTSSSRNTISLRLSYSTALIRVVNGLVDPLQKGVYARSIASIAAQLGLPAWLVELRHAATHEDLPSLELLRDAASQVSFHSDQLARAWTNVMGCVGSLCHGYCRTTFYLS